MGEVVRPRRLTAALLLCLGLFCVVWALALLRLLASPLLGFLLMGLPLLLGGGVCMAQGLALWGARLEMDDQGLRLAAPAWRGFPVPPLRRLALGWDEVRAVRRRREHYHVLVVGQVAMPLDLAVVVYRLETSQGPVVLGGNSLPRLESRMAELAVRAGVPVEAAPDARAGVWRTIRGGPPPWD